MIMRLTFDRSLRLVGRTSPPRRAARVTDGPVLGGLRSSRLWAGVLALLPLFLLVGAAPSASAASQPPVISREFRVTDTLLASWSSTDASGCRLTNLTVIGAAFPQNKSTDPTLPGIPAPGVLALALVMSDECTGRLLFDGIAKSDTFAFDSFASDLSAGHVSEDLIFNNFVDGTTAPLHLDARWVATGPASHLTRTSHFATEGLRSTAMGNAASRPAEATLSMDLKGEHIAATTREAAIEHDTFFSLFMDRTTSTP
jgi:hypothetical protein